ncbi:MAG: glycosyltransferase family 9 protein [Veillonellales bacterium]
MSNQYRNILVHSLVNIGDVLLSTSAVALLRQVYPDAKITMMVRPAAAQLVTNNPVIDEAIIYDYKAKHKSFGKMWQMAQRLRSKHFDLSISFDRKLRPALLTWLAGIPVRVGPDKVFDDKPSRVTMLYTRTIPLRHDIVNTLQAETYQAIIRGFTGTTGSAKPVMARIMPENEEKAGELLASLLPGSDSGSVFNKKDQFVGDGIIVPPCNDKSPENNSTKNILSSRGATATRRSPGPQTFFHDTLCKQSQPDAQLSRPLRIALCVKGTFPLKTWPKERFAAVADQLAAQYTAQFFIIGAPEDRDYADEVIAFAKTPIANFCGQTSLVDLAALLQKTDLLVTVDTGTAHIAATVGVSMIVIYGCTSPKRWHPINPNAVVLTSNESCCPCAIPAEACPERRCLQHINVEDVTLEVQKKL